MTRSQCSREVTKNEILASSRKTKQSYMWWGALCFAECGKRPGLLLKVPVPSRRFCLSHPTFGSSLAFVLLTTLPRDGFLSVDFAGCPRLLPRAQVLKAWGPSRGGLSAGGGLARCHACLSAARSSTTCLNLS